jgi:hypothetical protein
VVAVAGLAQHNERVATAGAWRHRTARVQPVCNGTKGGLCSRSVG